MKEEDEFVEQFEETIEESTDDQAVVEELNNNDEISVEILIFEPKTYQLSRYLFFTNDSSNNML